VRVTSQFAPLIGILIGALGGMIYWLAVQIWPSSVAVMLSMAATALLTTEFRGIAATRLDLLCRVLCLLIKYNTLMALSAAKLPFAVPPNVPLALIMICGYAASFALLVAVMAIRADKSAPKLGPGPLCFALLIGFAPAVFKYKKVDAAGDRLDATQLVTEACFYLGALATWKYV
jgi:hypothetical protein